MKLLRELLEAEKQYDDNARGAIQALGDMSIWDVSKAKAKPDPQVDGVWMVTNISQKSSAPGFPDHNIKGRAIVYLAGYKDPHGDIRKDNDFEDEESGINESVEFDEKFIRSVAKDRGVDLSDHSLEQVKKMHDDILRNTREMLNDPDLSVGEENIGQEYYDQVKQYFSG